MDLKQYLSDPTFLVFGGLLLVGFFFPQIKALLSNIKLPSLTGSDSDDCHLHDAEELATTFAEAGDEANTMLATAMMIGIVKEKTKDLLELCATKQTPREDNDE